MPLPPENAEEVLTEIKAVRKTGNEPFHFSGQEAGFKLDSFWRWSVSDLVSNATRGRLAEFIVASALGVAEEVRSEWDAYDLTTSDGLKVEVKSASYVQSWFQKKLSQISFVYKPTRLWTSETNTLGSESHRWADVYVFALLHHQTKTTIDPLNLEQWEFYVVATETLNTRTRSQHSITLRSLQSMSSPVKYEGLSEAVRNTAQAQPVAT